MTSPSTSNRNRILNSNNNGNNIFLQDPKWLGIGKDVFSGSISGMCSCLVGHPFDTIKVMLQDKPSGHLPKFDNGYQALKYLVQTEGVKGVYRGLSVPLFSVSFINSIFFATYNFSRSTMDQLTGGNTEEHLHLKTLVSGGIAGGMISLFITPRDLIKSKLQVQCKPLFTDKYCYGQQYKGPVDVVRQVVKHQGYAGLFRGLRPTFCRDIPGDMVYFTVYENIKKFLINLTSTNRDGTKNTNDVPSWVAIVAGGSAGASFWFSIYPIDVIKTRIQTQPENPLIPLKYTGVIQTFKTILKEEGWRPFYRGFTATILRSFPTSACNFLVYETIKKFLNNSLPPLEPPGLTNPE
ncbi:mitochondrial substrate carrier family protein [Tieghemostelium lacteum]|uniref:Mitochondrial substrate carrier family protein n=1 Tax=Tieghemostelium lacteum TaxID=361077 RepID=A0A152A5Z0_TIELA|nr:mitochondrial substrate carrier family protein [Tieghemostelium lacteum]|eukprot:KYR01511.1 mitochondrial substrate carrier family protein [Tieghemostelium lacteum]